MPAVPASEGSDAAKAPRYTVVIPLYNKARYVGATLGSVLAQACQDFEVLVVDDGSTDGGAEIVAACPDPRVRLLRQANAGVSVARNTGIAQARGRWIAFLDADDWLHPQHLARLAQVQDAHPQAQAVASRYLPFTDHGQTVPASWPALPARARVEMVDDLADRWMRGPTFFTGSVAIRRDLLLAMQPCFPVGESCGEDLDLWFRVAERTPVALLHAPSAGYRVAVAGSLSAAAGRLVQPPWVTRLRERAHTLPAARRRSALALAAHLELDLARRATREGRRVHALRRLAAARHAVTSRRWWFTAVMLTWPAALLRLAQPVPA